MRRLSIIIPNYNYRNYIAEAISSALAVDWPDVEVIVVDDGSTDDSVAVVEQFSDGVTLMKQPHSGPRVACNVGYARSTGDVVVFLDSDDVLDPGIARAISAVWRAGVSKVQVQMRRIDKNGDEAGPVFPRFDGAPEPRKIRYWMERTSAYPTPPGSGNAYSRVFLAQLFPLDDRCGDATDSACLAAAPFLGDVVTIPEPLVSYRVHGENRSNLVVDPNRFTRQIERAYQRQLFAHDVSGTTRRSPLAPLFRGRHLLQMRVAERRMVGGVPPIPSDSRRRMVWNSFTTVAAPGPELLVHRVLIAGWCLVVLAAPAPVARKLIDLRFNGRFPLAARRRPPRRVAN
jgi:glycosyltransferase involved in cell wall biosynthesis